MACKNEQELSVDNIAHPRGHKWSTTTHNISNRIEIGKYKQTKQFFRNTIMLVCTFDLYPKYGVSISNKY